MRKAIVLAPKIPLTQALRSWFIFEQQVYNIEICHLSTLCLWIEQLTATWTEEERTRQLTCEDDALSRWYTINRLKEMGVKFALYDSQQAAIATV